MAQAIPQPIPTPPDFPVTWRRPDEQRMFWTLDRMHFPMALTPLEIDFLSLFHDFGFNPIAAAYDMPVRLLSKPTNSYYYQAAMPPTFDPVELEAMGRRSQEKVGAQMARLDELWNQEVLPEVKQHIAYFEDFDLAGASLPDLLAHCDGAVERMRRLAALHFRTVFPVYITISQFDELYREVLGNETTFDAYKLLQGFDNKTTETGRALWALSRRALAAPSVRRILEERAAGEVIPALEQSSEGQTFLAELRAYLREFGYRGNQVIDLAGPLWLEDPTPAIKLLKDYVAQPDRDLEAEAAALIAERDQRVAEVHARLQGYPRPVVEQFEFLLKSAQFANVLTEDHTFYIDFKSFALFRLVLVELGRRLVTTGAVERPEDVFFLTFDELRETSAASSPLDRRDVIAARRAELEHNRTLRAPPAFGTPPPAAPPDNPMSRFMAKFWGAPPPAPTEPGVFKGAAGSPGVVRGTARVVRSLLEADKLKPGDILIAETTAPPWTPLFASAAAVVTDTGGILSHCAVVAREYGIPAVVGVGVATALIQDGQTIEVDGNSGVVRVLVDA